MYIPIHFTAEELVPEAVFRDRGDQSLELIDERVLMTLDQLRDAFGTCIVNDWSWGGPYSESGLRNPECDVYSATSQHTFGRAMDCKFDHVYAEDVRKHVIAHKDTFPYIRFIEDEVDWFHFDVRNCEPIQLWSPSSNTVRQV
jgi:hypothetical protein